MATGPVAHAIEISFNDVSYRNFLNVGEKEKFSSVASSVRDNGQFQANPEIPSGLNRENFAEDESSSGGLVGVRPTLDGIATDPFFSSLSRPPIGSPLPPVENLDAAARASYFENKARVDTQRTHSFIGRNDPEEFGYAAIHSALAESRWVDTWVADEAGIVELDYSFDAQINLNDILSNGDFLVASSNGGPTNFNNDLGIIVDDKDRWSFNLTATFAIFNLDQLVLEPESSELLPSNVASIRITGSTEPIELEDGELIDSPDAIALMDNGGISIDEVGTLSFLAIAGQRYRVVGEVRVSSRNGIEVDAYNTFSLDAVRVPPGLDINSLAALEDGAQLPVEVIPEANSSLLLSVGLLLGVVLMARTHRSATLTKTANEMTH
jgi:hypothetical protein